MNGQMIFKLLILKGEMLVMTKTSFLNLHDPF